MTVRRLATCCVFLLVALFATSAFAQDWTATFAPDAVNSYVTKDGLKYVVVAGGNGGKSVEAAAKGLAAALRKGSASLVMDDSALGNVKGLDDDSIVAKAKKLPVDRITVVRVFPGGQGKPDTAVVTTHDKASGEVVWAITGTAGKAVEAKQLEGVAGGVTSNASDAVNQVTQSNTRALKKAREEYAKRFVWFQDMVGVNQYGGIVAHWSNAYQGKYRKVLSSEEFYRAVDRPDLAEQYASNHSQQVWAGTMMSVGLLGVIGGGTWWLVEGIDSSYDANASTTVPMIVTGASAALMIGGIVISPSKVQPVTPSEARELADKHNQKLKHKLGLPEDYSPFPQPSGESMKLNFGIGAAPGGAAGVLRLEF